MIYTETIISPYSGDKLELGSDMRSSGNNYIVYKDRKYSAKDFGNLLLAMGELKESPDLLSRTVCHLFLTTYELIRNTQHFLDKPLSANLNALKLSDRVRIAKFIESPNIKESVLSFVVSHVGTGCPFQVHFHIRTSKISIESIADSFSETD